MRDRATGQEGVWFGRSSGRPWAVAAQQGRNIRLVLPDIGYLDPVDDGAARLVDRNTLVIGLPGLGDVVLRRI